MVAVGPLGETPRGHEMVCSAPTSLHCDVPASRSSHQTGP